MTADDKREQVCSVRDHNWTDGQMTVYDCEQYVRHTERGGGVGQWLVSVKADHSNQGDKKALWIIQILQKCRAGSFL